ncbi:VanZ family protein [Mycoplasma sp. P36-A1]|uniref:VanZ family protein n=1 Tax=Mycoplasma sp. P36-A1 TaxID=3252900 RepID=UPI003C2B85C0
MSKTQKSYLIIFILTLIYLFFFSSKLVVLTNLPVVVFNIISSILVFFYLDICYKLYIKKYQLNILEVLFIFASYLAVLLYLLFFKNNDVIDSSTLDFIPLFFYHPSMIQFTLLVGNIIMFIPIGYFYHRLGLKFGFIFIILLSFIIEGFQFFFKVGVFDLSDILLYIIGFSFGSIYYKLVKEKSEHYNNSSYDIRLVFNLIITLAIILLLINNFFF